jgi:[ribosomal protein S5]-alanine N-acetyltransferase
MFPQLNTNRFLLQQIVASDQAFIFKGLSHPDVIPYYGVQYDSFEATTSQMEWYEKLWQEKTGCWWKIVDKATNESMGACGMNYYTATHEKAEIGYWLLPEHWQKGIMSEVLPIVLDHLFSNWKLHRLEAVVEEGNASSSRLSEKFGFKYEGTLRESEIKHGKRLNLLMYALLATDR